jgi:hypothetical protein
MRRQYFISALLAVALGLTASAHDLFLKLDSYFLQPRARATVRLLNGTFQSSDGAVARERFRDVSLVASELDSPIGESISWRDEGKTTVMEFQTGAPGTYVVGVSTRLKEISLKAAAFNDYLAHDGLPDTLDARTQNGELNKDVRERYSKHVRAVFQVGDKLTDDYKKPLNYPVEILPQQNPYSLKVGDELSALCTRDGRPLPNQFVLAGWEARDGKLHTISTRSNSKGVARIKLSGAGKWYVKFIHMTPLTELDLNYESKWASLTFEIKGS